MGNLVARALHALARSWGNQEVRVCMLGLDNAGKTTVLNRLHLGETLNTIPTIGFNVETVAYRNLNFTMWDVGGQTKLRPLWKHYLEGTNLLVFVVDGADRDRINEARDELWHLLGTDELRDACLLVYCNKADMPNSMNASEISEGLQLHKHRNREWYVQRAVALSGEGLYEGLDWAAATLRNKKR